jgi:hypothetical protein
MGYEYKKQVSMDSLLGAHDVHDITCPRINVLQFYPRHSTKIFEEDLEQDPKDLKINLTELFKAMNDLDQWSSDIMKIVNTLPEDLYNAVLGEVFIYETDHDKLVNKMETDYKSEIKEYATEINGIIEQWQDYRTELEEAKEEELKQQKLLEAEEKNVLFLTIKGDDTTDAQALVEFYKEEVIEQQEKKADAFHNFERYIKDDFKKQAAEFSNFLETVRDRNDDIRSTIGEIKYQIASKARTLLNLYQPDEYLDITFGVKPSVVNLGVIFNDTETDERNEQVNFKSFIIGMRAKHFITFEQLNTLMDMNSKSEVKFSEASREEKKSTILDMLKTNGVITVRYYNDQKEYANDRTDYTEQQLNKPLYKPKFKSH